MLSDKEPPFQRQSPLHRPLTRASSARLSFNSGPGLANYSKLSVSMSYKNRQSTVYMDDVVSNSSSSFRESQVDDKSRMTTVSTASVASTYCSSRDSSMSMTVQMQMQTPSVSKPSPIERQISLTSSPINTIREDSDVSEVEIAAMQAKRALRRMCLSLVTLNQSGEENVLMDDDEDEEDEDEEENNREGRTSRRYPLRFTDEEEEEEVDASSHRKTKPRLDSDVITISRADLRQLQSRLAQLENKLAAQAEKHAELENNIEREVRIRTKKLEESYEAKLEELTMARDLEVDQEIQRRLSEFTMATAADAKQRKSNKLHGRKGLFRGSTTVTDLFRGSSSTGSELDQFKDFLMHNSKRMSDRLSRSTLFQDTYRDTTFGAASRETMDEESHELVDKLRQLLHEQDDQLEQAKYLISVAVVKMGVTEEVVQDAFEEMGRMDARLERQAAELAELRRFSSASTASMSSSTVRASGRYRS